MHKDTQEELKRLEDALLAEETASLDTAEDLEDFLEGLLDEPTDSLAQTGSIPYRNFANGYCQPETEPEFEPEPEELPQPKAENLNAQLYTATALLLGIAAVLIYWVVRFL